MAKKTTAVVGDSGSDLNALTPFEQHKGRGVTQLHLEVRAGNEAVALYTAHGFVKVGERHDYYRGRTGQSFDAHSYVVSL